MKTPIQTDQILSKTYLRRRKWDFITHLFFIGLFIGLLGRIYASYFPISDWPASVCDYLLIAFFSIAWIPYCLGNGWHAWRSEQRLKNLQQATNEFDRVQDRDQLLREVKDAILGGLPKVVVVEQLEIVGVGQPEALIEEVCKKLTYREWLKYLSQAPLSNGFRPTGLSIACGLMVIAVFAKHGLPAFVAGMTTLVTTFILASWLMKPR